MTEIAIACQGGGSHTAFAAGALQRLVPAATAGDRELIGLSGTSGGAVCATLAWAGLVLPDETPGTLLGEYWNDVAARGTERVLNRLYVAGLAARTMGIPIPDIGTSLGKGIARQRFLDLLEAHVDFEAATTRHEAGPALLISAVDVKTGEFDLFREYELRPEMVLASAAVPELFGAVEVPRSDGRAGALRGVYWDGVFGKNPPVKDFVTLSDVPNPDEVWVVQINPQSRHEVPRTRRAVADRRNELAANTALEQEVDFLEHVDNWSAAGHAPAHHTATKVRRVRLTRELDWSSKLDRSPHLLADLFREGRTTAGTFLARD